MIYCTTRTAAAQVPVQRKPLFDGTFSHLLTLLSYLEIDNKCSTWSLLYAPACQYQPPQRLAKNPCMVCNSPKPASALGYSCTAIYVRICATRAFFTKNAITITTGIKK